MQETGRIDERQTKVLTSAVRKANNAIAGEQRKPNETPEKPVQAGDKPEGKRHIFRGPRKLGEVSLSRLPETIRAAANRLKAKAARENPLPLSFSEPLSADCTLYFDALESAGKGLGRRLADYAEMLRTHEHDRADEERLLEWMAQFPVAPPESIMALLADVFDWIKTERPNE